MDAPWLFEARDPSGRTRRVPWRQPDKNLPAAARKFSPTPSVFGHAVENYDASPKCFRAAFAAGLAAFVVAAQPCLALGGLGKLSAHCVFCAGVPNG